MKRTQSKAVKPATKGAVKVPTAYTETVITEPEYMRWQPALTDKQIDQIHRYIAKKHGVKLPIRRNPRAARANKGRKV